MEVMEIGNNIYKKCGEIFLSEKTNYTFLCHFCNELLYEFNDFKNHGLLHGDEIKCIPNIQRCENDFTVDECKFESIEEYDELHGDYLICEEIENKELEGNKDEPEKKIEETQNYYLICENVEKEKLGENIKSGKKPFETDILIENPSNTKTFPEFKQEITKDSEMNCSYCKMSSKNNHHTLEECLEVKEIIKNNSGDFISLLRVGILCCCECRRCFDTYKKLYEHHKEMKHCTENNVCKICKFHTFMDSKMKICQENRKKMCNRTILKSNGYQKPMDNTEVVIVEDDIGNRKTRLRDFRFKCSFCERIFRTGCQLRNHVKIHTNDRQYKCEMCSAAFTLASYLKAHIVNKHTEDRPFSCGIENCNAKFKTFHFMKQHEKTHGKGTFQCEMCGNYYKTKVYLFRHQRSAHVDPKLWPYQCEYCHRKFSQTENLAEHVRIHTGEKPFGCNTCSKSFRKRSSLREHKKLHSEERKHICRLCGKGFKQLAGYWGHMKRHPVIN